MSKVRVLLAEECLVLRVGLRALLADAPDLDVVAEVSSQAELAAAIRRASPDVVLMGPSLFGPSGLKVAREMTLVGATPAILFLASRGDDTYLLEALRVGAKGCILQNSLSQEELIRAIGTVANGGTYVQSSVAKCLVDDFLRRSGAPTGRDHNGLTSREREILHLIAEGFNNHQICQMLSVSFNTVRHHRANLMRKLGVHNQAGLLKYALTRQPA